MRWAAIIDYSRENLAPEIWSLDTDMPKLQKEIREDILDIVYSALDDVGISEEALEDLFIYGSLLGNQYNKSTDLDARIVLSPDALPEKLKGVTGDQIYELLRHTVHDMPLGDTEHPFNATIIVSGDETDLDKSPLGKTPEDAVYDVLADIWVVDPFLRDEEFDPDEEFAEERDEVDDVMQRLDNIFRDTKTDIIDYGMIEDALSSVKDKDKFKEKLDKKLKDIESGVADAVSEYERIKKERTDAYAKGERHADPSNIEMKYLERYKYWDTLKQIKHLMEDGIDNNEVEILEDTMASKLRTAVSQLAPFTIKAYTLSEEEAKSLGEKIGINWDEEDFDVEQLQMGYDVELEHGTKLGDGTDVTNDDPEATAQIVWAHLKELPDYYDRLAKMEGAGKENLQKEASLTWDQIVLEELGKIEAEKGVQIPAAESQELIADIHRTLMKSDTEEDLNKALSMPEGPSMFGTTEDYVRDIVHAEAEYYLEELMDVDASLNFWAQFMPAEAINFWDLGMHRSQVAQMLGQVPLRGTYRITDDQITFDNTQDAQAVWEYFTLNM